MADDKQIKQWLKDGTITQAQAKKMLADTSKYKKQQRSDKLIITLSTIGAILLGLGAILFIASNWKVIPNLIKVFILVSSTFASYYVGYLFKYQKQNLPRVGASLLFLGALLFGATVFLIAQMYNINANNHFLVLIWFVSIIPLTVFLRFKPLGWLSSFLLCLWAVLLRLDYDFSSYWVLVVWMLSLLPWVYMLFSSVATALLSLFFYVWLCLFIFRTFDYNSSYGDLFSLPVLYLVSGVFLFGMGALHYYHDKFRDIARVYRIVGIKTVLVSLFFLTFSVFAGNYEKYNLNIRDGSVISSQFTTGFVVLVLSALILIMINLFFNFSKSETNIIENSIGMGLLAISLIFFFFPAENNIYVVLFNLILAGIIFTIIFIGYNRQDMTLVNIGIFWASLMIIVKYFDFFWSLLSRSVFFMIGGLILILGGVALEKKRRQLKEEFGAKQDG